MAISYEMYRMGADSFARLAEPAMQRFWDGYKQGLHDRFYGGHPQEELMEDALYARGYCAGLEGNIPSASSRCSCRKGIHRLSQ